MNKRPHLIVVGGFLGSGKTTLILSAARELEKRGLRSVAIMNDQSDALVDTEHSRASGIKTGEVTGGCFCCRFSELISAIDQLRQWNPDVIFAEPVGSCTDISATILQPLRQAYSGDFQLAPFTVLVDPARAQQLLDPDMSFLFHKQLDEADLICFTKSDLGATLPDLPGRQLSARTSQGVAAWLDELMNGNLATGSKILNIDYEHYARAEAALAWLNAEATFTCDPPRAPAMLLGPLLDAIDLELTAAGVAIVHMKAIDETNTAYLKAAMCANGQQPDIEGALDASPALSHRLVLNLRAAGDPATVQAIVKRQLQSAATLRIDCFSPAAPKPEHRLSYLV